MNLSPLALLVLLLLTKAKTNKETNKTTSHLFNVKILKQLQEDRYLVKSSKSDLYLQLWNLVSLTLYR